jgi:DNA-binding NarL/FixJ family response regulator
VSLIHTVLVVDDHEPWRRHVNEEIRRNSRWRVIGEAADGFEAIRKAETLKPDLILLDINMPTVNGLETARRILGHDPHTRVLFVTQERSPDVAEAALDTGAAGYILKTDTGGGRLLLAMASVANGARFIGRPLSARFEPPARRLEHATGYSHAVGFHSDDSTVEDDCLGVATAALASGDTFVMLVSDARRDEIARRLRARAVPVDDATREGRYMALDGDAVLSAFMVGGQPDEAAFRAVAIELISSAAHAARGTPPRVAVCSECAGTLWTRGQREAAQRLEHLCNDLPRICRLDIRCVYSDSDSDSHSHDDGYAPLEGICAAHSEVRFG